MKEVVHRVEHREIMEDYESELTGKQIGLPREMMHEILLRLPVKPLGRFKCVAKPWLSFISNPKFIAMHSKAIENEEAFFQRRRLVFTDQLHYRLYSLDLDQFINQNYAVLNNRKENMNILDVDVPAAEATELDFVYNHFPKGRHSWFPITLSCNNLLLSESYSGYHLVDPVAKKLKKLPKTPTRRRPWRLCCGQLFGLGFNYSTNEYKVVYGQCFVNYGIVFSVYTLKTDSWRQIKGVFLCRPERRDGIVVNGGVHWLLYRLHENSLLILSFLLAEETFRKIPLPPLIAGAKSIELGVFRDSLCITFSSEEKTFNEFWVMKEYGMRESWTKMRVSIPYRTLSHSKFWRGSHDLMVFDNSLFVMYNFSGDDKLWTLSIKDVGEIGSVGVYVESLASVITLDHAADDLDPKKEGEGKRRNNKETFDSFVRLCQI